MSSTLRLNGISIVRGTFDDSGYLLRRSRKSNCGWSDRDIEVIAIHIDKLVEEVARESDTTAVCQRVLQT